MGLREEKKQRQRQEIVEAALTLFRERGYDQTRVSDIAERVGISDATFFNYFAAKDLVLDELALGQVELFSETLRYQLGVGDKSVPDRIRETMKVAAAVIAADREFQTVLYTRSNLFHSSGVLKDRTHEMYRVLATLFELGQQRQEIRRDAEPLQLAEILIAIYHLTTINWLIPMVGRPSGPPAPPHGRDGDLPRRLQRPTTARNRLADDLCFADQAGG